MEETNRSKQVPTPHMRKIILSGNISACLHIAGSPILYIRGWEMQRLDFGILRKL